MDTNTKPPEYLFFEEKKGRRPAVKYALVFWLLVTLGSLPLFRHVNSYFIILFVFSFWSFLWYIAVLYFKIDRHLYLNDKLIGWGLVAPGFRPQHAQIPLENIAGILFRKSANDGIYTFDLHIIMMDRSGVSIPCQDEKMLTLALTIQNNFPDTVAYMEETDEYGGYLSYRLKKHPSENRNKGLGHE